MWNVVSYCIGIRCDFSDTDTCIRSWLEGFGVENKKKVFVGVAALIWSIWKARNLACFQRVWPTDPSVLMFRMSHWINDWSFFAGEGGCKGGAAMGRKATGSSRQ